MDPWKGQEKTMRAKKGMQYTPSRAFEMVVHCRLLVVIYAMLSWVLTLLSNILLFC